MLKKRYLGGAAAVACAVAGSLAITVGVGSGSAAGGDATAFSNVLGHVTSAPTGTPAAVIAAVASRSGAARVVKAEVGARPDVPGAQHGTYLHFVVAVPSADERSMRGEWEADLIQGAVADALAENGQQPVVGSAIDLQLPDGEVIRNVTGGMGDVAVGQSFSSASDASIRAALTRKLGALGLTAKSIDVLHADQPAPAVVVAASDPASAVASVQETINTLFGQDPVTYEGFYFEIDDSTDVPILVASAAYRSGAGRNWVDPQYGSVAPQNHG